MTTAKNMHPRQKEIFKHIVEEHIRTAEPVGSKLIVEKFNQDVSSATVRNDMMELEEAELIFQPHISAGRVPTAYGYKKFIENNLDWQKELSIKEKENIIKEVKKNSDNLSPEDVVKKIAKIIAEKSNLSVVVAFKKNDVYYTGLSNLFSQPEFQNLHLIYNISAVIDHLDEVMSQLYDLVGQNIEIKIGKENPFAKDCAVILIKVKNILIGILGPTRMNYQKNVELINLVKKIINF